MSTDEPVADAAPEVPPSRPKRPHRVRRGPILVVVLAVLAAAIVAQQNTTSSSSSSSSAAVATAHASAGVAAADSVSSAWYSAAGTSSPNGIADETVMIASLAHDAINVTVSVMPGGDAAPASRSLRLAPGEETRVAVADVLATAEPGVVVEAIGGPIAVSHLVEHGGDVGVEACTSTAATDWYFASGSTVDGVTQQLELFNPFGDDAIVDVGFVTDTGAQDPSGLQALVVPRHSRVTVPVQDSVLRQARVATHVHARSGRIVAEQLEIFGNVAIQEGGRALNGVSLSLGTPAPARVARIAAGSTRGGGDATLALANFTGTDAQVDVRVVMAGGHGPAPERVRVPSQSVVLTGLTTRIPLDTDYAVVVTSRAAGGRRTPVVAEMLASWSSASASTGVAGMLATPDLATRWVVPQPDVDAERVVTVFNPGPDPVTAELLPADLVDRARGATSEPELAIPSGAARTFRLALLGSRPLPAVITTNHPVVAGLTVLGNAGAAVSPAIPDFHHGG